MEKFEKIFKELIMIEKGYVNHPQDPGGETMYGITIQVARNHGYYGNMEDLTLNEAKNIYKIDYYNKYNFDLIKNSKISGELFEFTVNSGRGNLATKILQRSYNILNKNSYLIEDGKLGHKTAKAINFYKYYKSLYKIMNIFQGLFYISLAEQDKETIEGLNSHEYIPGSPRNKTFIRGWIDKRVQV